ncbi:sacsin N-terminal ATP-binding-like domain-containing protein [Cellulomonas sp. C5510]|uniref:sacsin N-terminal ATP-binding-like domain-containing protein n=1 Tax=Cellulomonas sp. C5510 TaxID=2871170 RepID=UPI001C978FAE|nr:ATP-binding protein [Cellulomonas sp. C5510]QZN86124.1 ATP-binding protein [Cellulomonas sp. C5510]
MTADVLGTRALRERVLRTWRSDPARLREDANTEEDHARGYYRDRVVVELAQNAADAAVRAGVPGRLLLRLTAAGSDGGGADGAGTGGGPTGVADGVPVLVAANTGAPLDEAGVASLASMRASSSRDWGGPASGGGLVGRFGVGFAAVRAVSDELAVLSTSGSVRFSLAETRQDLALAAAGEPRLADEVARREGSLPALRLPREHAGRPPGGYDTAVVLALRDEEAVDAVRRMLAEVGDPLLLALPALAEVVVEDDLAGTRRRVADLDQRWRRRTAEGELEPALVADRPVEERGRRGWRVTWALPRDGRAPDTWTGDGGPGAVRAPAVLHAPTPTDDPLDLPALLVATLPLDPTRRRAARGRVTDALLDVAGDLYALLAADVASDGGDALRLVPQGLPAGEVDAALRPRLLAALSRTPLLPVASAPPGPPGDPAGGAGGAGAGSSGDPAALVEPRRAVALAGPAAAELTRALAPWFGGMVVLAEGDLPAARALGVEVREVADVVEELPAAANLPQARWRALYEALAPAVGDPLVREALAGLPVPLADGRVVRGARGLLLPADGSAADRPGDPAQPGGLAAALGVLGRWGLRLVHPEAAHPVLERLGAAPADPAALLGHPGVRQAVLDQAGEDDLDLAEQVTDAVLTLVRATLAGGPDAGLDPGTPVPAGRAVLGLLTLRDADGEPAPAHGLVLPGSRAAALLDDRVLAPADPAAVDRWGPAALAAVGVRADLVLLRLADVATSGPDLDEDAELVTDGLDGWDDYLAEVARLLGEGESLPEVVAVADLDAVDPGAWSRVLARFAEPGPLRRALLEPVRAEQATGTAPSYTAWWLRHRSGLVPGGPFAVAGAEPAAARLLPPAPADVAGLDDAVLAALGGVARVADVPAPDWNRLLRAAAPVGAPVDLALAAAVWAAWAGRARAWADDDAGRPGLDVLPALVAPDRVALVHAEDAAVAPEPMWWQRTDVAAMVPPVGPADPDDLAEALGVPTADELADGAVAQEDGDDAGALTATPPAVRTLLPGAPSTWVEHESLRVDGVPVDWWVEGTGPAAVVHATHLAGLARGLVQAAGAWHLRHAVELVLLEPERVAELAVEQAADGRGMMSGR